jgi:hypothetical protein
MASDSRALRPCECLFHMWATVTYVIRLLKTRDVRKKRTNRLKETVVPSATLTRELN